MDRQIGRNDSTQGVGSGRENHLEKRGVVHDELTLPGHFRFRRPRIPEAIVSRIYETFHAGGGGSAADGLASAGGSGRTVLWK